MRCDQCEAAMINNVFCHEFGCPNTNKIFDPYQNRWIEVIDFMEGLTGEDMDDMGLCEHFEELEE